MVFGLRWETVVDPPLFLSSDAFHEGYGRMESFDGSLGLFKYKVLYPILTILQFHTLPLDFTPVLAALYWYRTPMNLSADT